MSNIDIAREEIRASAVQFVIITVAMIALVIVALAVAMVWGGV